MIFEQFRKKQLAFKVASAIAVAGMISAAGADTKSLDLKISEQDAGKALMELGERAGVEILLTQEVGRSVKLTGLEGAYTLKGALDAMLKGSGLIYEFISENSILIKAAEETDEQGSESSDSESESVDEEIVVTGSRIARTPSQMAANVLVLDGDELRASGESTLEGALRRLPQNMFGASPVGAAVNGSMSVNGAINITGASTINLRGLGAESTLILVDGRRIGKTGVFGGVSDITGIPFSAVERVEILLDGASSIYGSDAVGGVVNVILKKDYQGLEVSHKYSTPEEGGFEEHVFSVNGSFSWDSGRIRATYEHFQNSNLDGEERPESVAHSVHHSPARVTGLLIFTYQNQRYFASELNPLLGLPADPWFAAIFEPDVDFEFGPYVFLPDGQDGNNLSMSPDDWTILSDSTGLNNSDASEGIGLIPAQQRDTLSMSFEQALELWGGEVTLSGAAYYSQRQTYAANGGFTLSANGMPASSPFNPFGQPVNLSWYIPELGAKHYETDQSVIRWNLSLDGALGESWSWTVSAGQARDKVDSNYFNEQISNTSYIAPELRDRNTVHPDSILFSQLIDEGLNLFASDIMAANSPEILAQLVRPESPTLAMNEENTVEILANGTLFNLPGGDVYFSIGADWRQEVIETESSRSVVDSLNFVNQNSVGVIARNSLTAEAYSKRVESKTQRSVYAELLLPIVSAENAITGVEQLTLTTSTRFDSYHEHGSGSTRSLGLIWSPVDQVTLKINQSTSFVAPTFRDKLNTVRFRDLTVSNPGGIPIWLVDENGVLTGEVDFLGTDIRGGNPDLNPETASALAVGLEFAPDFLPGFTVKATWNETDYRDRIGSPPSPRFVSGVDYVALYPNLSRDEQGLLVRDDRSINIALVERAGIDYQLSYTRDSGFGQFGASVNIAYTNKYNYIKLQGDEPINQVAEVDIGSNTVIPEYRYSTRLSWYRRGLSVNLDAITASKTISKTASERRTVNPALNANLVMAYDFEQGDLFATPGWLQSTAVEFTVFNFLDDYTETSVIALATGEPSIFSEFNANVKDPRGRLFKLGITRRF